MNFESGRLKFSLNINNGYCIFQPRILQQFGCPKTQTTLRSLNLDTTLPKCTFYYEGTTLNLQINIGAWKTPLRYEKEILNLGTFFHVKKKRNYSYVLYIFYTTFLCYNFINTVLISFFFTFLLYVLKVVI